MYEDFYGLHSKPFQLNPDPNFYFGSKQHRRAKAYLDYGVLRNEGFIVITGEVGAGKTTIVRNLLDGLDASKVVAAQLVSTQLDAEDTLRMVGAAFGVRIKDVSKADLLMALEVFLVSQAGQGKRCLLVVDEAQNLTQRAVEELRMLSNFQFGKQALLQSFLVGQPEFRNILQDPQMRQLRQRVIAACHIGPLDRGETEAYIEHRLKLAGLIGMSIFDAGAYEEIFRASAGIPRRINSVCDRLLLLGFLRNKRSLSLEDVVEIEKEISEETGSMSYIGSDVLGGSDGIKPDLLGNAGSDNFGGGVERDDAGGTTAPFHEAEREAERLHSLEKRMVSLERANREVLSVLRQVVLDKRSSEENATNL